MVIKLIVEVPKWLCLECLQHKSNTMKSKLHKSKWNSVLHPLIPDLRQDKLVLNNNMYAFEACNFFIHD